MRSSQGSTYQSCVARGIKLKYKVASVTVVGAILGWLKVTAEFDAQNLRV